MRSQPAPTAKAERLERALAALRRRFGEWIVYRLTEAKPQLDARAISTGSLGLDWATGIGGVPRGHLTVFQGQATSGKTTLAFHVLAAAQRDRGFACLIDAGHGADLAQARRCGVDLGDLLLVVPETTREAFDIAGLLLASGGLDALVIGPMNDLVRRPADLSAFQRGLRRLQAELAHSPTAVLALVHDDPAWRRGARNAARALAHTARLRLAVTPLGLLTHTSGTVLGLRVRAAVTKNGLAPPARTASFEIWRDHGIQTRAELFDLAVAHGVLDDAGLGRGYWFGREWLGKSRLASILSLDRDAPLAARLREALLASPVWGRDARRPAGTLTSA